MKHRIPITLLSAALGLTLSMGAAAQQPAATTNVAPAPSPQGEAVDGLQLSLEIGSNTENITATQSLLYLGAGIRNVSASLSDTPGNQCLVDAIRPMQWTCQ